MSLPIQPQETADAEAKTPGSTNFAVDGGSTGVIDADLPRFRAVLTQWFREQGRNLPWRHTRDPYAILVSEIMLQQTQAATVVPYFERWLARFPDLPTLAAADEQEVLHAWQGLGYYSRARNLHKAAQKIIAEYGGVFPRDQEQIRALPGVGRYTAGAVATFAFDEPSPPVDGNILRVIARLLNFWEPVDSAPGMEHIWAVATRWQPQTGAGQFNEALMELGALICTPRAPACLICPVGRYCCAHNPEMLPVKRPRPKTVRMVETCGWIAQHGQVLLEQQTGARWGGLWKLPLLVEPASGKPLVTAVYPFTKHRVELSVFPGSSPLIMAENQRWFGIEELENTPMPAPHRRVLKRLLKKWAP